MRIAEKAFAKVNLHLDVLKKREDGYHDIGTIFQTLNLHDTIEVEALDKKTIELVGNDGITNHLEDNLIYKAAIALQNYAKNKDGINPQGASIYIEKNLPMGAGLGGGSADAAATLKALNKLWRLNYDNDILEEIGTPLGADVPFMVRGGTQIARGIGEILSPCRAPEDYHVLVVTPSDFVSTATAYSDLTPRGTAKFEDFVSSYEKGNDEGLYFNWFEETVFKKHDQIRRLKEWIITQKAESALMSGSGASVFGLFRDKSDALEALSSVSDEFEGIRFKKVTFFQKNVLKA